MRFFSSTAINYSKIGKIVLKIGKKVLKFPHQVSIEIDKIESDKFTKLCRVKGERGTLELPLQSFISIDIDSKGSKQSLTVSIDDEKDRKQRAMWGTARKLLENMVIGVTEGYTVPIRMVGVGYRANLDGNILALRVGRSHPVNMEIPSDISVLVPAPQRIILQGNDLQKITQFAASIRKWREPEPYNQKGIFVGDETIKKKEGKKR